MNGLHMCYSSYGGSRNSTAEVRLIVEDDVAKKTSTQPVQPTVTATTTSQPLAETPATPPQKTPGVDVVYIVAAVAVVVAAAAAVVLMRPRRG